MDHDLRTTPIDGAFVEYMRRFRESLGEREEPEQPDLPFLQLDPAPEGDVIAPHPSDVPDLWRPL